MTVAAVAWQIRPIATESEFYAHLLDMLGQCSAADLVVLPELCVLELMHLHPGIQGKAIPATLEKYAAAYESALLEYVAKTGRTVIGGSHIRDGANVCMVAEPAGAWFQPKNILTQWEAVNWRISAQTGLRLSHDRAFGVTICYDSEFPEAGRVLAEAGALVQCVPSYTETRHGFQRVRWSCHARAIENQVYVIHSSLVGSLWREPIPSTYGSSAIICPSTEPFPESAILAETPINEEGVAVAELDFETLLRSREMGDVRNWNDRGASDWALG